MRYPQRLLRKLTKYFGSEDRAKLWFSISNPWLPGNLSPIDFKPGGNYKQLEKMVDSVLSLLDIETDKVTKEDKNEP